MIPLEGPQTESINLGVGEMEGGRSKDATVLLNFVGEEELARGGNFVTPPCGGKQRGTWELGEPSRKVRWRYLSDVYGKSRLVSNSLCSPISDSGIINCNRRSRCMVNIDEPIKL